ncbi:MAG TPA: hypothetical protein VF816_13290 [Rhodocyclaceae bacterium]
MKVRRLAAGFLCSMLVGCAGTRLPTQLNGNLPRTGTIVPNTTLKIAPSLSVQLEKVVYWGVYAGVAYLILDPWAPNWEIEQAQFPEGLYHLSLHMKRVYSGGAGEARVVFQHRAKDLMRENGYDGYEILEYSEGLDSSVLGSQRTAEGVIRLTKSYQADS